MLTEKRIRELCDDGLFAGVNGNQAEWDGIAALAIKALLRPEESVVKDAARYRFLRDNPWFQIEYTGELTLDQHIDAEMENKP